MKHFWEELKRRKVIRVAVVYLVAAWVAVEVSSVLFPSLLLPDWASRLVVALALIGFPVVVALAWAFDLTDRGIQKTSASEDKLLFESGSIAAQSADPEDRLTGWKRIATFLDRDVRTVRRWEKDQNLPVHRVMHQKGATVYAWRSELTTWLEGNDQQDGQKPAATRRKSRFGRPGLIWSILVVTGFAFALVFWWSDKTSDELKLGKKNWVLITDFDNRSGEEVLDGTVEYALERELNNSTFVKVIARNRINDALALMELPQDTPVDLETGRLISLRDGAVSILLAGRIDRAGEAYALTVDLVNPQDSEILASLRAISDTQTDILHTVSALSDEVREALGEQLSSIVASQVQLSRVSTPSLQALQFYSRADALMSSSTSRSSAMPLLEQALKLDPEFASAHILLHYLYKDRDDMQQADAHLKTAMELSDTVSERERLFILSTDHISRPQEYEQAIQISEMLSEIYPDHFWAVSNGASLNQMLGRYDEAYPFLLQRADLRPNLGWSNLEAAYAATVFEDFETREHYIDRVEVIARDMPWVASGLQMIPFYEAWLSGDLPSAGRVLEDVITSTGRDALGQNPNLFAAVHSAYLSLGKLDEFRKLSSRRSEMSWVSAILETDAGDNDALDRYMKTSPGHHWDAMLLAWSGHLAEAEAIILNPPALDQLSRPYFIPNFRYLAEGEVAIANNKPELAIPLLERGLILLKPRSIAHHLFGLNSLARANLELGDVSTSIKTLESGNVEKKWSIFEPGATYQWMRNQLFLAQLYKQQGLFDEAKKTLTELRALLILTDADHPILLGMEMMGSE